MSVYMIWCNIFQIIGLGFVLTAGVSKQKNWILFLTFCANVCSILVMFFAGRYDGAAATVVCTIRAFLYLFQDRVKDNKIFWGSILAHAGVGILAWQSPISILIILAPVVLCYVSWFGKVRSMKYGTILSDICWAVFDISNGIYIEAARDIAEALSNGVGLIRTKQAVPGEQSL